MVDWNRWGFLAIFQFGFVKRRSEGRNKIDMDLMFDWNLSNEYAFQPSRDQNDWRSNVICKNIFHDFVLVVERIFVKLDQNPV